MSGTPRKGSAWLRRSLGQAAWAAAHTKATSLAARFRHLTARKGKKRAIVAVAHTLLVSRYYLLKNQQPYQELRAEFFDRRHAKHVTRYLVKRLARLGLQVTVRSSVHAAALLAWVPIFEGEPPLAPDEDTMLAPHSFAFRSRTPYSERVSNPLSKERSADECSSPLQG